MNSSVPELVHALTEKSISTDAGRALFVENEPFLLRSAWPALEDSGLIDMILDDVTDDTVSVRLIVSLRTVF